MSSFDPKKEEVLNLIVMGRFLSSHGFPGAGLVLHLTSLKEKTEK